MRYEGYPLYFDVKKWITKKLSDAKLRLIDVGSDNTILIVEKKNPSFFNWLFHSNPKLQIYRNGSWQYFSPLPKKFLDNDIFFIGNLNNMWCSTTNKIIRKKSKGLIRSGYLYKFNNKKKKWEQKGNRTDLHLLDAAADGTIWAYSANEDKIYEWIED